MLPTGSVGDDGIVEEKLARIRRLAVDQHFVMDVWTGSEPRRPDQRDALPALHHLATPHHHLGGMRIAGDDAIAVIDLDHVAVIALVARANNGALGGRHDWRAGPGCDI